MKNYSVVVAIAFLLGGCMSIPTTPATEGEQRAAYTYVPLDPLPVRRLPGDSCKEKGDSSIGDQLTSDQLLKTLTDQTVRMAIAQISANGELIFTSAKSGFKNESYKVILDYMNTDTAPASFLVRRKIQSLLPYKAGMFTYKRTDYKVGEYIPVSEVVPPSVSTSYELRPYPDSQAQVPDGFEVISFPIYVGLGMRLTANITVNDGRVELTGLPAIAVKAAAGNVSGSLVVQTLGVTGRAIATTLPLPSELNQTTLQNSLLAMGSIKALIHDGETTRTARIVGFENTIGGGQEFVSAVIGALSQKRHPWYQPCHI